MKRWPQDIVVMKSVAKENEDGKESSSKEDHSRQESCGEESRKESRSIDCSNICCTIRRKENCRQEND
jgi:hypothetical protein